MHLSDSLKERYTSEHLSAREAQRLAEFIAWAPAVFQATRLMLKFGILSLLRDSDKGLTRQEIVARTGRSDYAVNCLLEASLSIGTVLVDPETDRFSLSKTGWFLLTDPAVKVNIDFNQDVNYEGWFHLEESLEEGKPAGLRHFGPWPTIYEGLSSLPAGVRQSWFGFDHFYSESSFPDALRIVFDEHHVRTLYDVGGNTGKWALRCVGYSDEAQVTVLDLPQQIAMMRANIKGKEGEDRIHGFGINLLDETQAFPLMADGPDAIWMSQFLDCFSMEQIVSILRRAKAAMGEHTRIYIMETLWDRQRFEPATMCLTLTSLYFSALANGNSKMYNTEDMGQCIHDAGLEVEQIHDHLGQGHSILVVKKQDNNQ
ncbi:O-methyltransferase [Hallella multisaccharivorax DSM 17128]|uniref:O-methyltransferase family 2 n=1 Tax=Hallella multisaccharivorax DSM 17128 TaxID=688246 RepID=F8N644_9BACT|nr:methyltransferase [Hallella multisaccharivorax]EGN58217.1 O-methyltransferase family 2 [Hallella multisaccharivorax DSM 17128]GJG31689.1 O-methyltransferase [Hallella multisaccharivorax DSM 17128]